MNREDISDAPIDLGAVTVETKGGQIGIEDLERTFKVALGLTDD